MSKDHLVPTPIVDKNGKTTVTYRKPAAPKDQLPGTMPAPTRPMAPSLTESLVAQIAKVLELDNGFQYDSLRETVNAYPEDLINKLLEASHTSDDWAELANLIMDREPAPIMSEIIHFFPSLHTESLYSALVYFKSMHHYPQLPPVEDFSKADQHTQEQYKAILTVMEALDDDMEIFPNPQPLPLSFTQNVNNEDVLVIDAPVIVALIMERPHESKRIAQIIIERRTRDAALIAMILDDTNPTLAEGNL